EGPRIVDTTAVLGCVRNQREGGFETGLEFGELAGSQLGRIDELRGLGDVVAHTPQRRITGSAFPDALIGGSLHRGIEGVESGFGAIADGVPCRNQIADSLDIDLVDLGPQRGDIVGLEFVLVQDLRRTEVTLEPDLASFRPDPVPLGVVLVLYIRGIDFRLKVFAGNEIGDRDADIRRHLAEIPAEDSQLRWLEGDLHQGTCPAAVMVAVFSMSWPVMRLKERAKTSRMSLTTSICSRITASIERSSPVAWARNFLTKTSAILNWPKPETFCVAAVSAISA